MDDRFEHLLEQENRTLRKLARKRKQEQERRRQAIEAKEQAEAEARRREAEYQQACENFRLLSEAEAKRRERKRQANRRYSRQYRRRKYRAGPATTDPRLVQEEDASITRFTPDRGDVIIYTHPKSVVGERLRFDVLRRGRIPADEFEQLADSEYWQYAIGEQE